MKQYSIDDLLSLGLCKPYDRARLEELLGERTHTNADRIAKREEVPVSHRLWLLLRLMPSDTERGAFASECLGELGEPSLPGDMSVQDALSVASAASLKAIRKADKRAFKGLDIGRSKADKEREKQVKLALKRCV